jgi:hypothetical protein
VAAQTPPQRVVYVDGVAGDLLYELEQYALIVAIERAGLPE